MTTAVVGFLADAQEGTASGYGTVVWLGLIAASAALFYFMVRSIKRVPASFDDPADPAEPADPADPASGAPADPDKPA